MNPLTHGPKSLRQRTGFRSEIHLIPVQQALFQALLHVPFPRMLSPPSYSSVAAGVASRRLRAHCDLSVQKSVASTRTVVSGYGDGARQVQVLGAGDERCCWC